VQKLPRLGPYFSISIKREGKKTLVIALASSNDLHVEPMSSTTLRRKERKKEGGPLRAMLGDAAREKKGREAS